MTSQTTKKRSLKDGDQEKLIALARRCLHLAYVWNDHNFPEAHIEAREQAQRLGINSFEAANEFLGRVGHL